MGSAKLSWRPTKWRQGLSEPTQNVGINVGTDFYELHFTV